MGQMPRMSSVERETSIAINRSVDLAKAALHIAAEDDALVSHSSVPLPVDAYVERLDDLAMGFFHHFHPPSGCSPELYLSSLEHYLYVHQVSLEALFAAYLAIVLYFLILSFVSCMRWGANRFI